MEWILLAQLRPGKSVVIPSLPLPQRWNNISLVWIFWLSFNIAIVHKQYFGSYFVTDLVPVPRYTRSHWPGRVNRLSQFFIAQGFVSTSSCDLRASLSSGHPLDCSSLELRQLPAIYACCLLPLLVLPFWALSAHPNQASLGFLAGAISHAFVPALLLGPCPTLTHRPVWVYYSRITFILSSEESYDSIFCWHTYIL